MILPYALRLLCVCLASFFLLHLTLASLVRSLAIPVLEWAEDAGRHDSARAADLVLGLRLLPTALTIAILCALCIPSYLSFENERGSEATGILFLAAAALGASIWALSLARTCRALLRSHRCLQREAKTMGDESQPIMLLEGSTPLLGLAGVLRPRVVMSRKVACALDAEQLSVALRHEWAHRTSRDNFKRLLLLLTPEPLPGLELFRSVDRAWARFAEWAADDQAVGRDARRCVSLAEALVRVARLGAAPKISPLVSPFVPDGEDIAARVERLLNPRVPPTRRPISGRVLFASLAGAPFAAAAIVPGALGSVHRLLEQFMH